MIDHSLFFFCILFFCFSALFQSLVFAIIAVHTYEKVHTLHIVGLHLMIMAARCQLANAEDDVDDDEEATTYFGDDCCDNDQLLSPVVTLYVLSLVRVRYIPSKRYVACGTRVQINTKSIDRASLQARVST